MLKETYEEQINQLKLLEVTVRQKEEEFERLQELFAQKERQLEDITIRYEETSVSHAIHFLISSTQFVPISFRSITLLVSLN